MKTSGIDYLEAIFAGENKMRTRLAGFVFVIGFHHGDDLFGIHGLGTGDDRTDRRTAPDPSTDTYSYGVRQRPQKPPVARLVAIRAGR